MANDVDAAQDEHGWTLRFGDPLVTQLRIDHCFSLLLGGGALIVIENAFELTRGSVIVQVPPGDDVVEVGEALPLFNARVDTVQLAATGEMRIDFGDDGVASVPVNPHYENWQVFMPDDEMWIGIPGGGVSHHPAS